MINIIFIRKKTGRSINLNLSVTFLATLISLFLCIPLFGFYLSNNLELGHREFSKDSHSDSELAENLLTVQNKVNTIIGRVYQDELDSQQDALEELKQYNHDMVQSLMLDLAKLQAHIIRLESLGNRLAAVAELDENAFNFSTEAAIGGMGGADDSISSDNYEFLQKRMAQVTQEIHDRSQQFDILENLLINEELKQIITPAGKPAEKGWISSYFGLRKDPFTGKKKMHKGIDMAGKSGTNVVATADGVVIRAEKQKGYGQVLDIDHGYGISTRYGHNKTVLVKVGDIVKQGQPIATMGSTGRSTGPHVHYEVLKKGIPVNPARYITTTRKTL